MKFIKSPFFSTPFFTVVGRAGGFFIPILIGYFYGAGFETDAFFLAFGLVIFFTKTTTYIFESIIIPYLVERKKSVDQVSFFANGAFYLILPVLLLGCFGVILFLKPALVAMNGWEVHHAQLAVRLFLEMFPFLLLGVWISVGNGIFYTHKMFWFPALSPALRSLVVIFMIFFAHRLLDIDAAAFGFSIGEALRWGIGFFLLQRSSLWRPWVDWTQIGQTVRNFFQNAGFQLAALLAVNLLFTIDLWFAAGLGEGSPSLLNYADRFMQIAYLLLQHGFLPVFHSHWSESYYQESPRHFWDRFGKDLRIVSGVSLALALLIWVFRSPLIWLVFGQGELSESQLLSITRLFAWLAAGLVPVVLYALYVRVLFVLKKSFFYFSLAWIHLVSKVILNYVLIRFYGVEGIVMATALLYGGAALWLHFYLKRVREKEFSDAAH